MDKPRYDPNELATIAASEEGYKSVGLRYNPFPESGLAPSSPRGSPLEPLGERLWEFISALMRSRTYHAGVLLGGYGSGKTHHLLWLKNKIDNVPYPIKAIYISSPGVEPYHLVREVIRQIGRSDLVTLIWSLVLPVIREGYKARGNGYLMTNFYGEIKLGRQTIKPRLDALLFSEELLSDHRTFLEQYDRAYLSRDRLRDYIRSLLTSGDTRITEDQKLAQELASTAVFDEYEAESSWRSLTAGKTIYPKGQEALFLLAVLTLLKKGGYHYLTLLVDEFEGLLVGGRLSQRQVNDYLVTLRHMIDETWHAIPMAFLFACTPQQWNNIKNDLYPAGADRMRTQEYQEFVIPALDRDSLNRIISSLLEEAYLSVPKNPLQPFTADAIDQIPAALRDTPRSLIRACHALIELAATQNKTTIDKELVVSYTSGIANNAEDR